MRRNTEEHACPYLLTEPSSLRFTAGQRYSELPACSEDVHRSAQSSARILLCFGSD